MMRNISILLSLIFALNAQASFNPISIKPQSGSKNTVTNLQVPKNQATLVAPSTYLIQTGNPNLLVNPGFEHSTPSTGWTLVACTGTATSSLTTGTLSGYPGENQYGQFTVLGGASGGTCSIKQEVTTLAGSQGFISALLASQLGIPANSLTAYTLVNGTRTTTHDFTNTGTTFFWDETFAYAEVSTGTSLGLEIVITAPASTSLSAYIDRAEISLGKVTKSAPLITREQSYTPTIGGMTVTSAGCRWAQIGQKIAMNCRVVANVTAASSFTITLPNSYTASSSISGYEVVGRGARSNTANTNDDYNILATASSNTLYVSLANSTDNSLSPMNGNATLAAGDTFSFFALVQINELQNSTNILEQNCGARCENDFSAKISSADVVSDENVPWISGNCTNATTGYGTCTFDSGILTATPNCSCTADGASSVNCHIETSSSSAVTYRTRVLTATPADTNSGVILKCSKTGADYTATRTLVASLKESVTMKNAARPFLSSVDISSAGALSNNLEGTFSSASCSSGSWTVNFTGTSLIRSCQMGLTQGSSFFALRTFTRASGTQVTFQTVNSASSLTCGDINLTCEGYLQ